MIHHPVLLLAGLPLGAYLVGSVPFGVLIARARGVDLRRRGSGNVGATNVARVLGRKWGYLCFVLDFAKGLGPVLAAGALLRHSGDWPAGTLPPALLQLSWLLVGFGAIAGHVFNPWLKLRGGKGVATALGVVVGIYPFFTWAGLVALALWVAVTLASRYVSLGSVLAAAAFVPLFVAFNWIRCGAGTLQLWPLGSFAAAMAALILIRHRSNIARLLAGTENKIGRKRSA